jgi:phosphate transport system substrate-binding protein
MLALAIGCGSPAASREQEPGVLLRGSYEIDGSSTVYPVTEAVAKEFQNRHLSVHINVGISGTTSGFRRFCNNEVDFVDASRPINADERLVCAVRGREFIELPVAFDGISVLVNPANTWVTSLTTVDLKKIWEPASEHTITRWNHIRPEWPDRPLTLYGPGADSGTFDYFNRVITGSSTASRRDFISSEDDYLLVSKISEDANALGYFGYAYYAVNRSGLRVVPVDSGEGPVEPSEQSIHDGTYSPLSRPIFIYVAAGAADRLHQFVLFYLTEGQEIIRSTGYVPLPVRVYDAALRRFEGRVLGSEFADAPDGAKIEDLFSTWDRLDPSIRERGG